jgi:ribosome biogenesis GTPase A
MGSSFSRLFRGGPNDTNDTNTTIQEYIVAAKKAEEAQKNAENAAKAAENREKAYTRLAEEATEARVRAENAAAEARREVQEDRERLEEAIRQAQAASKRAEEALKAAEEQRIHAEEQRMVLASQLEQAQTYLRRGLQPVVWPTDEEFKNAKKRVQYRPDSLHFAVCGFTGTGKSSLINAVRGLANHENGTAPTGVVETTMKIQRYPDTRKEDPFPRFVWFDVPGGGGAKVTDWQYFNEQGLFIFDVIVVVYDTVSGSAS